jgi:hypothetical protein
MTPSGRSLLTEEQVGIPGGASSPAASARAWHSGHVLLTESSLATPYGLLSGWRYRALADPLWEIRWGGSHLLLTDSAATQAFEPMEPPALETGPRDRMTRAASLRPDLWIEVYGRLGGNSWWSRLVQAFQAIAALGDDWDGYGAHRVEPSNMRSAARFLAALADTDIVPPHVAATPSGGVQLDWRQGGLEAEIVFEEDGEYAFIRDVAADREWEGQPHMAGAILRSMNARLSEGRRTFITS